MRLSKLRRAGLVESTGRTSTVRYWIAGEIGEAPTPAS
jgi:hypothetical protein